MRIGILGGGQLGRMFIQNALKYNDTFYVLDPDNTCPCATISQWSQGNFNDYETVMHFGKDKDLISIEIEHVHVEALKQLQKNGIQIIPDPSIIEIIQQKILQKKFYKAHQIPSPDFEIIDNPSQITFDFPFVQKLNIGGYDGKGVQIIRNQNDLKKIWNAPSVIEKLVDIEKELSVIIAQNSSGEIKTFPVTEMIADPLLNLLDFNISPAGITLDVDQQINCIVNQFVDAVKSPGIFAIELFLDKSGKVWVNETAPRLHNSGHLTQEGNANSQFEQFYRVLKNYPLANTDALHYAGMLNVIGEENHNGNAHYEGLENVMKLPGTYVHLYGKKITKPGRKMGHINLIAKNREELIQKLYKVKPLIKVITKE